MPIYDAGDLNTSALPVPDAYIGIVPPQPLIDGAPSGRLGLVGTASWGAVNSPIVFGDVPGSTYAFGPITARKHDLGTAVYLAALQGANDFAAVRVTDGTETKAHIALSSGELAAAPVAYATAAAAINAGIGVLRNASELVTLNATTGSFTALHPGIYGDTIAVFVGPGARVGSFRVVVTAAGRQPEVFDNLTAPAGHVPTTATMVLSGGTDGADGVDGVELVGDEAAASGMHALREQACSFFMLIDCDESTTWTLQAAFAKEESSCAVVVGPAGDTIAAAIARKAAAGVDDWRVWCLHGDWLWINDTANGLIRLVSPQAAAAGRAVALSPERSPLNKTLNGILGSQRVGAPGAGTTKSYSTAELGQLFQAGIDVVTNPAPRGKVWAVRAGHNSSSDAVRRTLAYTTMTNFVAKSVLTVVGPFIGETISPTQVRRANAAFNSFFASLQGLEMIGGLDGAQPWRVVCDQTNNPTARTGIGYLKADIQVRYLGIIEKFLVDLEGGASVSIG